MKKDNNTNKTLIDKLKIKILKGVLNKDELGKPFIEYITEINYNTQVWRVNKKFNQFANLHKSLKNIVGEEFNFPDSSNIFVKIQDISNNFHENKIKQLETYVRDITEIPVLCNSKTFKRFFEFHLNTEEDIDEKNQEVVEKSNIYYDQTNFKINSGYKSENSINEDEILNNYNKQMNYNKDVYSPKINIYSNKEGTNIDNITGGFKNKYNYKD